MDLACPPAPCQLSSFCASPRPTTRERPGRDRVGQEHPLCFKAGPDATHVHRRPKPDVGEDRDFSRPEDRLSIRWMAEERVTPSQVSGLFAKAISAGDLEAAMSLWSPDAVIVSPDGSEVRGHAALSEHFSQLIASRTHLEIHVDDEVCTALGATAKTRMTMTVPAADGETVIEVEGQVVYVPGPGGLQILIDRLLPSAD